METAGTSRALLLPLWTLQLGVGLNSVAVRTCCCTHPGRCLSLVQAGSWSFSSLVRLFGGGVCGSTLPHLHWTSYGSTLQLSIQIEFASGNSYLKSFIIYEVKCQRRKTGAMTIYCFTCFSLRESCLLTYFSLLIIILFWAATSFFWLHCCLESSPFLF